MSTCFPTMTTDYVSSFNLFIQVYNFKIRTQNTDLVHDLNWLEIITSAHMHPNLICA